MRPRAFVVVTVLAGSLVAAAGCATVLGFDDTTLRSDVNSEGGPDIDGGPDQDGDLQVDGAPSRLTTTPASVVVRRGSTADITVEVARGSDVAGVVTARLTGLPTGVTATNATLPPPTTSGKVTLTAAKTATLGPKTINLVADGTSLPAASIPLLVADAPGSLDTTFDADGFVTEPAMGLGGTFLALALQNGDGKIVAGGAGGAAGGPRTGWLLRRYTTTGAAEPAFTTTTTAALPVDGELRALAIDAAGKIICAGSSAPSLFAAPQLTVARLLPTGALDPTFGGGIIRLPAAEAVGGSIGLGVAVQADGAVVVVGSKLDALAAESGVITRFKTNGTRDATFNAGATVVVAGARLVGVSIDAAGAVIAAGSTSAGTFPSYIVTKRTAAGASDPTFGAAGTTTFGNTYRGNAFTRLEDGSIVLVGDVQQGAVAYTAGATSDKGVSLFTPHAFAAGGGFFGIAVQDQKRFVAAGHSVSTVDGGPGGEARVERISVDGTKDPSFGAGGTSIIEPVNMNGFDVTLFAAAVQTDARILVAGNRSNAGAVLYRLWQ